MLPTRQRLLVTLGSSGRRKQPGRFSSRLVIEIFGTDLRVPLFDPRTLCVTLIGRCCDILGSSFGCRRVFPSLQLLAARLLGGNHSLLEFVQAPDLGIDAAELRPEARKAGIVPKIVRLCLALLHWRRRSWLESRSCRPTSENSSQNFKQIERSNQNFKCEFKISK